MVCESQRGMLAMRLNLKTTQNVAARSCNKAGSGTSDMFADNRLEAPHKRGCRRFLSQRHNERDKSCMRDRQDILLGELKAKSRSKPLTTDNCMCAAVLRLLPIQASITFKNCLGVTLQSSTGKYCRTLIFIAALDLTVTITD